VVGEEGEEEASGVCVCLHVCFSVPKSQAPAILPFFPPYLVLPPLLLGESRTSDADSHKSGKVLAFPPSLPPSLAPSLACHHRARYTHFLPPSLPPHTG